MVNWKTVAIIFIILFLIETIIFGFIFNLGLDILQKETECSVNICQKFPSTISYYFDYVDSICYCLDVDNNIVKEYYID